MQIIHTNCLTHQQKEIVCQLWNQEYPVQLSYHSLADFDTYLNKLLETKHFLLLDAGNQIKGWAASFVREEEKWFVILVDATLQGKGMGTLLLHHLKSNEHTLNGWIVDHNRYIKKDGKPYLSPLKFYEKNGFTLCANNRLELETLSVIRINWKQQ